MTHSKTLMLAAAAALSLGVGTAIAQESADGAFFLNQTPAPTTAPAKAAPMMGPQAGSSDVDQNQRAPQPVLLGQDGNA